MKVSIHLTRACGSAACSKSMTLRDLDIDAALSLLAALRRLPGDRIDATIVSKDAPVTHTTHTFRRRHPTQGATRHVGHGKRRGKKLPPTTARTPPSH